MTTKPKRRTRDFSETSKHGPNLDQRDAAGRFQPGHKVSVGNRGQRDRGRLRRLLAAAITDDDILAIAKTAVKQARAGDRHARQWLADRLAGKPREEQHDAQGVQLGPLDTLNDLRTAAARVATSAAAGDLDLAVAQELSRQLHGVGELLAATELADRVREIEERLT